MSLLVLSCVRKGRSFGPTNFALSSLLLFNDVGVDICLLSCGDIFDLGRQIDALVIAAFIAILGYFTVGLSV